MFILFQKSIKNISRAFFVGMFVFVGAFSFATPAHAEMWGMLDIFGDMATNMMEQIERQIEGALIGSLKMAAVQMLNQQVGQLMGGGAGGQARFITNFNDFLYQGPRERANLYMNDFFTMTTRGRGSSANYISSGDTGGIGGNYAGHLVDVGRSLTVDQVTPTYDLDNYCDVPGEISTPLCLNGLVSNPMNNDYGAGIVYVEEYQSVVAEEEHAADIKATASGFLPAEEDGNVIAPAASIEAATTKIQNLPSDLIANATNPGELLSGVVSAMANQVVNNLVRNGVGQVQANIRRQVGSVSTQVSSALSQATRTSGPGASFSQSVSQQSIRVNPSTSSPPAAVTCSDMGGVCSNAGCSATESVASYSCGSTTYVCCIPN